VGAGNHKMSMKSDDEFRITNGNGFKAHSAGTDKKGTMMINTRAFCFAFVLFLMNPLFSSARDIAPFVSPDWLEQNSGSSGLLIIDIRSAAEFKKSHIPNALNSGLNSWTVNKNDLLRELPDGGDLIALMGSLGMQENSRVVVVGKGESDFDRADAIRAAWTILLAGVKNVAVLDGGFQKWAKEKKPATSSPTAPSPIEYKGQINELAIASKKYVLGKIGKSAILDARTPDVYFGVTIESFAQKAGHIKSGVNLPAPWAFTKDGILRNQNELASMAKGVIGANKSKEVIVYCGVGVYATVWSYILTELLEYKNVKVYDGSMQEWIMDPVGPISVFSIYE
jgi:thiosulfate/3-mercaptopyruvate sulfurtransferase